MNCLRRHVSINTTIRYFSSSSNLAGRRASSRFIPRAQPNDPDAPLSSNDQVAMHIRNRNPMNLEKMRIGYQPTGFPLEKKNRCYWNKLELFVTGNHTTARVVHWTGRPVCSASTKEWAISRFLYNNTDVAAIEAVAQVIGQRCLETGVHEVYLTVEEKDMQKEKMAMFVEAVKHSGLIIGEGPRYKQVDPHRYLNRFKTPLKPWEVIDE